MSDLPERRVILATVAGGEVYQRYAESLMESAREFFHPSENVELKILEGVEGWPNGTLFRYHCLLDQVDFGHLDYVFLCDADMRFEQRVGDEVLPHSGGLVAAQHPGYVNRPEVSLPYECRPNGAAYIKPGSGGIYYAGGFVGGRGDAMQVLCKSIIAGIRTDIGNGLIALWHDESHLNRFLSEVEPSITLSPAYVHPDNDGYYQNYVWPEPYPRILVALDKNAEERGAR